MDLTTKMRERHIFLDNLWISDYYLLDDNDGVYLFSIQSCIRDRLVNSLPKDSSKTRISASSSNQMLESALSRW